MFLDGDETFFTDAGAEDLNTPQQINSTVSNDKHVFARVIVKHGPSGISSDDNKDYEGRGVYSYKYNIQIGKITIIYSILRFNILK